MSININIIDQRITKIAEQYQSEIVLKTNKTDKRFLISTAFVCLCISTVLDIPIIEALEFLTDGGNDAGIDGLHISDLQDNEFLVTIFQGKYKQKLDGLSHFPENSVIKLIDTVRALFDPYKKLTSNPNLQSEIENIRTLISDGYLPIIRIILCNNGLAWNEISQQKIDNADFGNQVNWSHWNHDKIINLLQKHKRVQEKLQLVGKAIIEDFNYRRVLIGKVAVTEIQNLLNKYGESLLERNIRRYLGLQKNRVNLGIQDTLLDPNKSPNFYFYNNGITMTCNKFSYNALQQSDYKVEIDNLQIINGGQTCMTIRETLSGQQSLFPESDWDNTYVLLRLYELNEAHEDLVNDITYATNSQNPVDLSDLRSNDKIQQKLELSIKDLAYEYKRKREDNKSNSNTIIPSKIAAKAILSIWRKKPHQVKFREKEVFGQFYDEIFTTDLNASQLIIAVLIYRMIENKRKHGTDKSLPFLPYASQFLAMLVGEELLKQQSISLNELNHTNFAKVSSYFEQMEDKLYLLATNRLKKAIQQVYGNYTKISQQRLAGLFRRGELLEFL
jgi:hypothetical protein